MRPFLSESRDAGVDHGGDRVRWVEAGLQSQDRDSGFVEGVSSLDVEGCFFGADVGTVLVTVVGTTLAKALGDQCGFGGQNDGESGGSTDALMALRKSAATPSSRCITRPAAT